MLIIDVVYTRTQSCKYCYWCYFMFQSYSRMNKTSINLYPPIVISCCVTHSPTLGKTKRTPSDIYVENVRFDWFNQYFCTGEHPDIFLFDFMFVKSHDVPRLFCFNVQNDITLLLEQLLFPGGSRCKNEMSGAVVITKISCQFAC